MGVTSIINRGLINEGIGDSTAQSVARTTGVVESAMTLNVPSDFTTLQDAMDWIEARVLLAEVTIQIADGTYNMASGEYHHFQHPNYALVNIIGNTSTPSNVTFNCSGDNPKFYVNKGTVLRSLQGIKISGGTHRGIYVNHRSHIYLVSNVEVTGQGSNGLAASTMSSMFCSNVNSYSNTDSGFYCIVQSLIVTAGATSQNNGNFGFDAVQGGRFRLTGSTTVSGNSSGSYNLSLNTLSADGSYIANS